MVTFRRVEHRKANREGGPAPDLAFDSERASHLLHEALRDCQPETDAGQRGHLFTPIVRLEDGRAFRRRDARPRVRHTDLTPRAPVQQRGSGAHRDGATKWRELDGIPEQIDEYLS